MCVPIIVSVYLVYYENKELKFSMLIIVYYFFNLNIIKTINY